MRHAYNFLMGLPSRWSHMNFEELLLIGALLTLVITVILMLSGRRLTE